MADMIDHFEAVVRRAHRFTEARSDPARVVHPFDDRDIHPGIPGRVRSLFDDGHFSQATFEAFKFLDRVVQKQAAIDQSGFKLMMKAFSESSPSLQLTPLSTQSERDEQKGFQFLFAGSMLAIRNPRGHEVSLSELPDQCLSHLSLASLLLRRLEESAFMVAVQDSEQLNGAEP